MTGRFTSAHKHKLRMESNREEVFIEQEARNNRELEPEMIKIVDFNTGKEMSRFS